MSNVVTFPGRRRDPEHEALRRHLHDVIKRALALLDCLDGDPDLRTGPTSRALGRGRGRQSDGVVGGC